MEERDSFAEEIENLTSQLKQERDNKYDLEQRLTELKVQKTSEVEALSQKLSAQSSQLESLSGEVGRLSEVEGLREGLLVELEMERGRVLGECCFFVRVDLYNRRYTPFPKSGFVDWTKLYWTDPC